MHRVEKLTPFGAVVIGVTLIVEVVDFVVFIHHILRVLELPNHSVFLAYQFWLLADSLPVLDFVVDVKNPLLSNGFHYFVFMLLALIAVDSEFWGGAIGGNFILFHFWRNILDWEWVFILLLRRPGPFLLLLYRIRLLHNFLFNVGLQICIVDLLNFWALDLLLWRWFRINTVFSFIFIWSWLIPLGVVQPNFFTQESLDKVHVLLLMLIVDWYEIGIH